MGRVNRQPWSASAYDRLQAEIAAARIVDGDSSVYRAVQRAQAKMPHRSWESIRQRINRIRRAQVAVAKRKSASKPTAKRKAAPSKRRVQVSKPSQRALTAKDLRDIDFRIDNVRESAWAGIQSLSDQVTQLREALTMIAYRITALEEYTSFEQGGGAAASESASAHERTDAPEGEPGNMGDL